MSAPRLVYADHEGNVYDHPGLAMRRPPGPGAVDEQCIDLPEGSGLSSCPGACRRGWEPAAAWRCWRTTPAPLS
ncbi:hypothetical protein DFAR_1970005 [Desulfarculales bacterium]